MSQLDLRLGPRQHEGTVIGGGLAMAVHEIENGFTGIRDNGPERAADLPTCGNAQATAQGEHGIENRACRIR